MLVCLDSLMIILGHHYVAILLEKMLIWAPFSQLMCTFSLCINPCHHLHNLKNVKNNHGGMLLLLKMQVSTCNFTKSTTPPWMFFRFFKLYKLYQIA